jgi:hypothetical protein
VARGKTQTSQNTNQSKTQINQKQVNQNHKSMENTNQSKAQINQNITTSQKMKRTI